MLAARTSQSFDAEVERLPRARLRELQDRRFRRLVRELENNGFYREKLRVAGEPSRLTLEDLPHVPFTTKPELVAEQRQRPPFGDLLTYPLSRYPYFHQTSGTSGSPLLWLDTAEDWESWIRCWGCVYRAAGVGPDDVIFFPLSFGPYISHWAALDGARQTGALCISGAGMNSLHRLQTILSYRATVVLCTPTYALRLAEVAHENGLDLAGSDVRITIHAGEPGASVPHVRQRIEEAWGARCFDHAGATEVGAWGFQCRENAGVMHLNEAEFVFEVIHPAGGEPVAAGRGELVITALSRLGMPAVRYRTGDLVELTGEACRCGRTFASINGGVIGRADDMLIVRGVNIYPSAIDDIVRSLPTIAEYEVELRRQNGMDDLVIKVETAAGSSFEAVRQAMAEACRARLNIRVTVLEAAAGTLPRYENKARRYKRVD